MYVLNVTNKRRWVEKIIEGNFNFKHSFYNIHMTGNLSSFPGTFMHNERRYDGA